LSGGRTAPQIYKPDEGVCTVARGIYGISGADWHLRGRPVGGAAAGKPGTILVEKDLVKVVCGESSRWRFTSVKQEGRKEISAGEFLRGARMVDGERFGK